MKKNKNKTISVRLTEKDFFLFKSFLEQTEQTQTFFLRDYIKKRIKNKSISITKIY